MTYLDTHIAIWLRQGDSSGFSRRVEKVLEAEDDFLVSPMVVLEFQMLYEIGRIPSSAETIMADLGRSIGLRVCDYPFGLIIEQALEEKWTREPADRIITAHARVRNATLVTHDARIRENYKLAVW